MQSNPSSVGNSTPPDLNVLTSAQVRSVRHVCCLRARERRKANNLCIADWIKRSHPSLENQHAPNLAKRSVDGNLGCYTFYLLTCSFYQLGLHVVLRISFRDERNSVKTRAWPSCKLINYSQHQSSQPSLSNLFHQVQLLCFVSANLVKVDRGLVRQSWLQWIYVGGVCKIKCLFKIFLCFSRGS